MTTDSNMGMRLGIGFFWSHKDKYCVKVVVNKEGGAVLALACLLEKEVLMCMYQFRSLKMRRNEKACLC